MIHENYRVITIQDTLVLGSILAPESTLSQNSGYVVGKVIVGKTD